MVRMGDVTRALLVVLPVAPAIAAEVFYPTAGLISNSFALSGSALLPVLVSLGYALAGGLEYYAYGRTVGLLVTVPLTLAALTTIDQDLLSERAACDTLYCVVHSLLFFAYVSAELVGLWWRGYSVLTLMPLALSGLGLGVAYVARTSGPDFDAARQSDLNFANWVETVQVVAIVGARALVATAPHYD